MNKKTKIIVTVFVILILGIGGFFWWQKKELKGSPADYIAKDTEQGKIIENKKAGLIFKIPLGWVEKNVEIEGGPIGFYTPETEGYVANTKTPPLKKGCLIEIATAYNFNIQDFDRMEEEIRKEHESLIIKSDEFTTIEVDGNLGLKNTFNSVDLGPSVGIYIVNNDKLYGLTVVSSSQDVERCAQEFDKFLETVQIQ